MVWWRHLTEIQGEKFAAHFFQWSEGAISENYKSLEE